MARPSGYALATVALAALLSVPLGLAAQDEGGTTAELSYTEALRWEDDELRSRSDLGLSYSSRTRRQYFLLDMFGGVEKFSSGNAEEGIVDPRLSLDYGLENRNSAIDFAARYRRADVDALTFDEELVFDENLTDPTVVLDPGTRTNASVRLGLELGREAPFGGTMSLGYASTTYADTTSPLLIDDETLDGTVRLRFDVSPRISAHTTLAFSDLDRDGGIDVRRETLSVGAAMLVSPVLNAQVDIGTTRVIESGSVPRTVDSGLFYTLELVRTLANGTLAGSLISDLDENGRRTTLQASRALTLPRSALSFGAGLSRSDDSDNIEPLYSFAYVRDLPRGQFNFGFEQSFGSDSVGNETLNTQLQMRVEQSLTSRDQLSAEVSLRNSDRTSAVDTRFASFGVDYSRTLTDDWSFVSGYTHTRRTEGTGGEDIEDIFFIGLSTIRQWRP